MDRRVAGIVVLIVALLAVVVVPSISGRRVTGNPIGLTFADPPRVGDCLTALPAGSAEKGGGTPEVSAAAITFGTCSGSIGGEVVGVWPTAAAAQADQSGSRRGGPCYRQAADFAGLLPFGRSTDVFGAAFDRAVYWKPTIGFNPVNVVPEPLAAAAGRTWVACLVIPTRETSYRGTLRAAYVGGRLPDAYGLCWNRDDLDSAATLLHCDEPHAAELLATGWVEDRSKIDLPDLDASCLTVAGRIMRTADPTRQGAISIVTDPVSKDGAQRADAPLAVNCFATAVSPQQLSGTVIGLGDSPLPLVG
ncbi:MAG: hypothetical protein ABJD68_12905 [Nakamurella sp.]